MICAFRHPVCGAIIVTANGRCAMETGFADTLRKFRKEADMTQEKLAEALGVTTGAVYKWENGVSHS